MAEACSVTSKGSRSYRRVARTSQVDESLFGTASKGKPGSLKQQKESSLDRRAGKTGKEKSGSEVVTVSKEQLKRMMEPSPILTAAQVQAQQQQAQEARDKERAHSNARKAKMLAMEEARKNKCPPTETELLKQQADHKTLSRAEELMLERQDEAKAMAQMVNACKCVTIRDAQLAERKYMMLENEAENRRLDLIMEQERLKALDNYAQRDEQRRTERMQGAKVLQEQLQERARERIRVEEQQECERLMMLKEMERLRQEELRQQVEKKIRAQQLVAEVMDANAEQIERKKAMQQMEVEEDARIADYNKQKQLREAAIAEEKERIAREKEAECARLRAAQEKVADKQSELDELRARRHAEVVEREWREREAAKAARNKAILEDLHSSRQAQQAVKLTQQAEMAQHENSEFERIIRVNQAKEEQDSALAKKVAELRAQHQSELLAQIAANEEKRKLERAAVREAGREAAKQSAEYVAKIERIKQRKLKELEEAGVPAKYCAELMKYKVGSSGV